jgi:hypothetical protein
VSGDGWPQGASAGGFDRSRELFERIVAGLADPESGGLTHGALEDLLVQRSRELTRSLLQDHLDLRAAREERRAGPLAGADGVVRARVEQGHRRGWRRCSGRSR